jgi:hypothetical protein
LLPILILFLILAIFNNGLLLKYRKLPESYLNSISAFFVEPKLYNLSNDSILEIVSVCSLSNNWLISSIFWWLENVSNKGLTAVISSPLSDISFANFVHWSAKVVSKFGLNGGIPGEYSQPFQSIESRISFYLMEQFKNTHIKLKQQETYFIVKIFV